MGKLNKLLMIVLFNGMLCLCGCGDKDITKKVI